MVLVLLQQAGFNQVLTPCCKLLMCKASTFFFKFLTILSQTLGVTSNTQSFGEKFCNNLIVKAQTKSSLIFFCLIDDIAVFAMATLQFFKINLNVI